MTSDTTLRADRLAVRFAGALSVPLMILVPRAAPLASVRLPTPFTSLPVSFPEPSPLRPVLSSLLVSVLLLLAMLSFPPLKSVTNSALPPEKLARSYLGGVDDELKPLEIVGVPIGLELKVSVAPEILTRSLP
jgi:hypothetical protein